MDQISAKYLRDSAEVLALPLRNMINLLIDLSTFPEECKIAKAYIQKMCKDRF